VVSIFARGEVQVVLLSAVSLMVTSQVLPWMPTVQV